MAGGDWQDPVGMDVVAGDYSDTDSLREALTSVDAVFLVSPVHPDMSSREVPSTHRWPTQPPDCRELARVGF